MKVWDLHCDTLYELRRAEKAGAPKSFLHNDLHIDLEKLQQGDYLLQCFAAYVDLADPAPGDSESRLPLLNDLRSPSSDVIRFSSFALSNRSVLPKRSLRCTPPPTLSATAPRANSAPC